MTLPRELNYRDGILYQTPVRELEKYRKNPCCLKNQEITGRVQLDGVKGRMLDFTVEITAGNMKASVWNWHIMRNIQQHSHMIKSAALWKQTVLTAA